MDATTESINLWTQQLNLLIYGRKNLYEMLVPAKLESVLLTRSCGVYVSKYTRHLYDHPIKRP
jgi:hypothetical protein